MRGYRRGVDLEVRYDVEVRNTQYQIEWSPTRKTYYPKSDFATFSTPWDAEKWVEDRVAHNAKPQIEGNEYRVIRVARELWCDSF